MMTKLTFIIGTFVGFVAGFIIGIYVGFMTYKNDTGKIKRFYNEREIAELKKRCEELERKLKVRKA